MHSTPIRRAMLRQVHDSCIWGLVALRFKRTVLLFLSFQNQMALADVPLAHALHMASGVPAAVLGLDQIYGGIADGRPASLTCLAADFTPEAVYVHGCRSAAGQPAGVSRPDGNRR